MNLKARRKELGLTQQKVADKAGIRLVQYQLFEMGKRDILNASFSVASRVITALELDLNDFYLNYS